MLFNFIFYNITMNKTVEWLLHFSDGVLNKFIKDIFSDTDESVSAIKVYADITNTLEELWWSELIAELQNARDELNFIYLEQENESRIQRKCEDYIE